MLSFTSNVLQGLVGIRLVYRKKRLTSFILVFVGQIQAVLVLLVRSKYKSVLRVVMECVAKVEIFTAVWNTANLNEKIDSKLSKKNSNSLEFQYYVLAKLHSEYQNLPINLLS